jgi:hypothetical protein
MFKWIILFSAVLLASCAAFFSVTGIAQLFVGAMIPTAIMAIALELGKLVSVSFLYRYWNLMSKSLRTYMFIGTFILMIITSLGIYGYLSSAYAAGSSEIQSKENQISLYDNQINTFQTQTTQMRSDIDRLQSIRIQQENRMDSLLQRNRSITTQQTVIRENSKEISNLQKEILNKNKIIDSLQLLKTNTVNSIGTTGKIGTFYYISKSLNIDLDSMMKWFILVLVFVFDPMSIALFLAYNVVLNKNNSTPIQSVDSLIQEKTYDVIENLEAPQHISKPSVQSPSSGPYYMDQNFDWNTEERWKTDPQAIAYFRNLGINPLDKRS